MYETEEQYFAYTVASETTAKDLVASLKLRISSENYGKNPVKLTWDAETSASEFAGMFDSANATDVTINNNLTLAANTRFQDVVTDKFVVNGYLTVDHDCTLELPEVCIIVDGTLKANNQSTLKGNVIVCGAGQVIIATGVNNTWQAGTGFTGWVIK